MITILIVFFIIAAICSTWALYICNQAEGQRMIRLFPLWVICYFVVLITLMAISAAGIWGEWAKTIYKIVLLCWVVLAILLVVTFVFALIKKQYKNALRIGIIELIIAVFSLIWIVFVGMAEGSFDHFGRRHPIPDGMEYLEPAPRSPQPKEQMYWDSLTIQNGILLIDEALQWGTYKYMAYLPPMEEGGIIYLKLYEATSGLQLSAANIEYNTTLEVFPSDSSRIYRMRDDLPEVYGRSQGHFFTIKEGSWGDYYAARVELWFKPESGDERLLMTRIYKVQGWSR